MLFSNPVSRQIRMKHSVQLSVFVKMPGLKIHQFTFACRLGKESGLDVCDILNLLSQIFFVVMILQN